MDNRGTLLKMSLLAALLSSGLAGAADGPGADRVAQMLSAARDQAQVVKSDMSTMNFFAGSPGDWDSHASIVYLYLEHIAALRRQVASLVEARSAATPLQKTTIDRITPLLQQLAADTEALIRRINQNPGRLNGGAFKDYLRLSADEAAELTALVGNFVDYGTTRQQLEELAGRLDTPTGTF